MKILSTDFIDKGEIPSRFTCEGEGRLPSVEVSELPAGTKSMVLIIDDPDAPRGVFTHYVLFNIPVKCDPVRCDLIIISSTKGKNSDGDLDYRPPCPPSGTHRYFFRSYALDKMLDLPEGASRESIEAVMGASILGRAELMGKYSRKK